ncbi:MAG: hypothetical protein ACXWR1_14150 [Bdellovibrionota bacterium]
MVLFALVAAAFANAAVPPLPAAGHYEYQGSYSVEMKLHFEVVYAFTDSGAAELIARRKAGEECRYTERDTYLCRAVRSAAEDKPGLDEHLTRQLSGSTLELGIATGEPGLISQGDNVAEYSVAQSATFNGKTYGTYRLVNAQGNWSIRLGEPVEAQFNLNNGTLGLALDVPVSESRTEYSDYVVSAGFRRM